MENNIYTPMSLDGKQHLHPKGQQPEKGHCPLSIHIARTRLTSTLQARACMCTPGSFASSTTRALGPLDYHTGTQASCLAPMTTRMIIHNDEDEPVARTRLTSTLQARACMCTPGSLNNIYTPRGSSLKRDIAPSPSTLHASDDHS